MSSTLPVRLQYNNSGNTARGLRTPVCNVRLFRLLLASFDVVGLVVAWHLTLEMRILLNPFMSLSMGRDALKLAAPSLGGVLVLWTWVVLWLGLYRRDPAGVGAADAASILKSVVVAGTLVIVVTFFSREFGASLSRSFVLLFVPVSFGTLTAGRHAALIAARLAKRKWPARERVAIMGESEQVDRMADAVRAAAGDALTVVGVILPNGSSRLCARDCAPVLGTTRQLAEVINTERLDRIILADDGPLRTRDIDECARISKRMDVTLSRAISVPDPDVRLEFTALSGLNFIELRPVHCVRKQEVLKRITDLVVAATCLAFLIPLFVFFALLIKLTSKGPIFYKSRRVGRGGRHFTFLKFRSMRVGSEDRGQVMSHNEQSHHLFKIRNDPRVTPVGRFMRRYSIDELPQLINVLLGDMSLVGPRPLPAQDLDPDGQSTRFRLWAEQRSRVLPGLTGLWQVRGRSDLSFEKMVELDLFYISNWSLWLDLRILLATPLVVLIGRGAY